MFLLLGLGIWNERLLGFLLNSSATVTPVATTHDQVFKCVYGRMHHACVRSCLHERSTTPSFQTAKSEVLNVPGLGSPCVPTTRIANQHLSRVRNG
jgi:hypothetical protein